MRPTLVLAAALLAGCLGPVGEDASAPLAAPPLAFTESFSGVVRATAAGAGVAEHRFTVSENATHVRANLTWTSDGADLALVLVDPDGEEDAGFAETPTRRSLAPAGALKAGEWRLKVLATRALDEPYAADVFVTSTPPATSAIEAEYRIDTRVPVREVARLQHGGYAEINLVLREGDAFTYAWSSDAPVYFNIHYHADGKTERAVEERDRGLEGSFTAPLDQVFSLLWRNENPGVATVDARVEGVFFEHSRTR